jgi:hypothetical protein
MGRSLEKRNHKKEIAERKFAMLRMDGKMSRHVRERDGNKCCHCGDASIRIDVHHIIKRRVYVLRWDEKNLLCLCMICHAWAEARPVQFMEWLCFAWSCDIDYLNSKRNEHFKISITNLLSKEIEIDKLIGP